MFLIVKRGFFATRFMTNGIKKNRLHFGAARFKLSGNDYRNTLLTEGGHGRFSSNIFSRHECTTTQQGKRDLKKEIVSQSVNERYGEKKNRRTVNVLRRESRRTENRGILLPTINVTRKGGGGIPSTPPSPPSGDHNNKTLTGTSRA